MNTLSVVIITFNEERNIKRCLDSVVPVADEIIVVDSYSTDDTEALCRTYGRLRFVKHEWEGFIQQKNFANSLASCDLILSIDADEALSEALTQSIQKIKEQDIADRAWSMNRMMNYCGKWIRHCGWYPDAKVRIFARGKAVWTGKKVHETLSLEQNTEVEHIDGDLLHYSYYTQEEHWRRIEKYALLSAEEMAERGKNPNAFSAYLHAGWKFLRDYVFKAGFLDGGKGWAICRINAYGVWYKYRKANELAKNQAK